MLSAVKVNREEEWLEEEGEGEEERKKSGGE